VGRDAAVEMLARVGEATDVFDAQLVDVLASDDRLMVLFRVRIAIGAREVELDYMLLGRVVDDVIVEVWTAALEPAAIEAFWQGADPIPAR
jgi:hypothetical protein